MTKIMFIGITIAAIGGFVVLFFLNQNIQNSPISPVGNIQQSNHENTAITQEDVFTQYALPKQPQDIHQESLKPAPQKENEQNQTHEGQQNNTNEHESVMWSFNNSSWSANSLPPDCPNPFTIETPVDIKSVTAALWPGQVRGEYKGHGGFRFNAAEGANITVRAPVDSHLVQASQYLSNGDKQYLLFFSVPCGYFYRFDHIRRLPLKLQEALEDLPPAVEGDSRTTRLNPPLFIQRGEIVGTSAGILPSNIFVDFGLYYVRSPNNVTPNPAWAGLYETDVEFGHYGVCFFDYLQDGHGQLLRSLPTGQEGKTSDYCK